MTYVPPTVLVVDDEAAIRRFLRASLEPQGWRVIEAENMQSARALAASHTPDVCLLDLGLPDGDGKDLVRHLRSWSSAPIVVVSARTDEREIVAALDAGADDYVTKPFGIPELLARVRVALRRGARVQAGAPTTRFEVGELAIDLELRRVTIAGRVIELTPLEFKLLAELARHPGRVSTHDALLVAVWGPARREERHLVRVHMANLRAKLEVDTARPRYLLTELGVGYRLADE